MWDIRRFYIMIIQCPAVSSPVIAVHFDSVQFITFEKKQEKQVISRHLKVPREHTHIIMELYIIIYYKYISLTIRL